MKISRILIAFGLLASSALTCPAEESVEWVAPVKQKTTLEIDSVPYHFDLGQWYQITGKDNGMLMLNGNILQIKADDVLDMTKCDSLVNHAPRGLADKLRIVNDSILYFDFSTFEDSCDVKLFNMATGESFKTMPINKPDSMVFSKNSIDRKGMLLIAPADNLVEIVDLSALKSEKVAPAEEVKEETKGFDLDTIILISAGVLVLIAVVVFFSLKLRSSRKAAEEKTEETGDGNADGDASDDSKEEGDSDGSGEVHQPSEEPAPDPVAMQQKIQELTVLNRALTIQLEKEKAGRDQMIEKEKARIERDAQKLVDEARKEADKEKQRAKKAEDRAYAAEEEARATEAKVTEKFKGQIDVINSQLDKAKETLKQRNDELRTVNGELTDEKKAHTDAQNTIVRLSAAIRRFDDKLGDAAFAQAYCRNILRLLEVADNVQKSATDTLKADIDDPYFVYKAIAAFTAKLDNINIGSFYSDVDMVSNTGFVPKGTPLATYDPKLPKSELDELTKNYFFSSYLKDYINALVVFNESMIGLAHLVPDMPAALVRPFEQYRAQIQAAVAALGINVLSVKIFDFVHNNTDLLATEVDGGYDTPGVILEIENCLVSLSGAPRDGGERIRVKVQQ